jgi:competence CoiA-like predicted nuclease
MINQEESESIFTANTAEGEIIFIGQAQSGKNGYFCRSCGFELVAKIGIGKYVAHFAHAVRDAEHSNSHYGKLARPNVAHS